MAEWPYEVPGNWCWTKVGCISEIITGGTPSKKHPEYYGGEFPFFKPSDLDSGRNVFYASEYLTDSGKEVSRIIPANSSAVCCIGSIGKCGYLLRDGATNQQINSAIPCINPLYLFYYFNTEEFVNELRSKASATTISIVNKSKMEQCTIPLAPLPEQQRIVARIESLFAKLDEAKEKAQAVVDSFEERKAAILHHAFTGELTKEFPTSNAEWNVKRFDEVAIIRSNLVDPKEYQDYPHIAPDNIEKKTGRLLEYRTIAEDKVKSGKHRFYSGQILYSKIRPYLSKVVMVSFDGLCSADMYPIESKDEMNPKYLWYYMLSDDFLLQASSAGSRSVLPKINQKELSALKVPVTCMEVQTEIVRILDSLLDKQQQARDAAAAVLDQIDTMKKSILARAFRGELGTNDPAEESAVELVKGML